MNDVTVKESTLTDFRVINFGQGRHYAYAITKENKIELRAFYYSLLVKS